MIKLIEGEGTEFILCHWCLESGKSVEESKMLAITYPHIAVSHPGGTVKKYKTAFPNIPIKIGSSNSDYFGRLKSSYGTD